MALSPVLQASNNSRNGSLAMAASKFTDKIVLLLLDILEQQVLARWKINTWKFFFFFNALAPFNFHYLCGTPLCSIRYYSKNSFAENLPIKPNDYITNLRKKRKKENNVAASIKGQFYFCAAPPFDYHILLLSLLQTNNTQPLLFFLLNTNQSPFCTTLHTHYMAKGLTLFHHMLWKYFSQNYHFCPCKSNAENNSVLSWHHGKLDYRELCNVFMMEKLVKRRILPTKYFPCWCWSIRYFFCLSLSSVVCEVCARVRNQLRLKWNGE